MQLHLSISTPPTAHLADNRTVTQADKTLAFTSSATTGTSHFTVDGTAFNVDAVNNRVGIGTATPTNKLEITTTGANTGIKLPNGASSGKVLVSDTDGTGCGKALQFNTKQLFPL